MPYLVVPVCGMTHFNTQTAKDAVLKEANSSFYCAMAQCTIMGHPTAKE